MLKIDLNAIRARVAKTTPGPWEYAPEEGWITAPDPRYPDDGGFIVLELDTTESNPDPDTGDLDFVLHARQDILDLLDLLAKQPYATEGD